MHTQAASDCRSQHQLNLRLLRFAASPHREEPVMLAQDLLAAKRPVDALQVVETAMERDPDDSDLLLTLGVALFQSEELEWARRVLVKAVSADEQWSEPWRWLGETLLAAGDRERGVQALLRARTLDGESRGQNGGEDGAVEQILRRIAREDEVGSRVARFFARPELVDPALLLQDLIEDERFEDAVKVLHVALADEDDDPDLLLLKGRVERARGNIEGAKAALEMATELDPGWAEAWSEFEEMLVEAGDENGAREIRGRADEANRQAEEQARAACIARENKRAAQREARTAEVQRLAAEDAGDAARLAAAEELVTKRLEEKKASTIAKIAIITKNAQQKQESATRLDITITEEETAPESVVVDTAASPTEKRDAGDCVPVEVPVGVDLDLEMSIEAGHNEAEAEANAVASAMGVAARVLAEADAAAAQAVALAAAEADAAAARATAVAEAEAAAVAAAEAEAEAEAAAVAAAAAEAEALAAAETAAREEAREKARARVTAELEAQIAEERAEEEKAAREVAKAAAREAAFERAFRQAELEARKQAAEAKVQKLEAAARLQAEKEGAKLRAQVAAERADVVASIRLAREAAFEQARLEAERRVADSDEPRAEDIAAAAKAEAEVAAAAVARRKAVREAEARGRVRAEELRWEAAAAARAKEAAELRQKARRAAAVQKRWEATASSREAAGQRALSLAIEFVDQARRQATEARLENQAPFETSLETADDVVFELSTLKQTTSGPVFPLSRSIFVPEATAAGQPGNIDAMLDHLLDEFLEELVEVPGSDTLPGMPLAGSCEAGIGMTQADQGFRVRGDGVAPYQPTSSAGFLAAPTQPGIPAPMVDTTV